MVQNTTQGQRLKLARKAKGWTQSELASKVGTKSYQVIQSYEKDKRGTEHPNLALLVKIAKETEVSLDWILTGKGDKNKDDSLSNSRDYPAIKKFAPIIEWDEIHKWKLLRNDMNLAHKESTPLFGDEGKNCFGLRVKDDSMVSTEIDGDSFKPGDILIIDPDQSPSLGDYVVTSVAENEPVILRHFIAASNGIVLRALNRKHPDYPVTDKVLMYGVVIGQHRKFKKH